MDSSRSEIVILKLHGSIDWFDRSAFDERVLLGRNQPIPYLPEHHIFGQNRIVEPIPLTDGPRSETDKLASIFRISNIGPIIKSGYWDCTPFILSPSTTKLLYSQSLKDLWWGIQQSGGLSLSLGLIGYSLPSYDFYARQVLYHMYKNYTDYEPNLEHAGRRKTKFRILDMQSNKAQAAKFKKRYQFVDPDRTEIRFDGLNEESVDWLLS